MGFRVLFGEDVDEAFLYKLNRIDEACYEPKYWGEMENTLLRFRKNPRSFVFVLDDASDELAGYINFFPCEQGLYEDNLFASPVIRDDDITPDEVAPYRVDENHLFIISLCVHPDYQGGECIKLLSNSFIDYLLKPFGSVAHFHYRLSGAMIIKHLLRTGLKYFLRHHGRSG